jgi:uncharacterized membrane protein
MPRIPLLVVALFFISGAIGHFAFGSFFARIMPAYLPWHLELVYISGLFELLGAIGILFQRTRLLAAYGLMALCVAVFPANLNMALHPELSPELPVEFLYGRLPFQPVFIWFIWRAVSEERKQGILFPRNLVYTQSGMSLE